jgi:hypothetical protein
LLLFQADPHREEKLGITTYIVCRECGGMLESLGQHLVKLHDGMRTYQYRTKWPGALRISIEEQKRSSQATKKARAAAKPKPAKKRGRPEGQRIPERDKRPAEISAMVERLIPDGKKQDQRAIEQARDLVSTSTRLSYDTVAQYHKRSRQASV